MLGTIGQIGNRIGGYAIITKEDTGININVSAGSKILCTNCEIDDESTLISDGSIIKTTLGYDILKDLNILIIKDDSVPLTVLLGRELLYVEGSISGSNIVFNLPKGARVNNTLVETTGEFSIATSTKYLIEY